MSPSTYTELEKLDDFLALPRGTSRSVLSLHERDLVTAVNEKLVVFGLRLDEDTTVAAACRPAWKALMQRLGISNAWWYDGAPDRIEPAPIADLCGYDLDLDQ
jgi:hypothetical protein